MKNILFVGEHPASVSGNGGMMHSVLSSLDFDKYNATCFALESTPVDPSLLVSKPFPFALINAVQYEDNLGRKKLLNLLGNADIDAVVFVGIDIWVYHSVLSNINKIVKKRQIPWISIFPYDLQVLRNDWVTWIKMFDYPCVYSEYGKELLKPVIPNIRYFRPPLQLADIWQPFTPEKRKISRKRMFPTIPEDNIIFGFVGANQIRKDPQKIIKAFSIVKKELPNITLYLHTNLKGIFDLTQYCYDCGLRTNDVISKPAGVTWNVNGMVDTYNSLDCLVNASLQEGLSWTLIEAMLCGLPFIATRTTAQIELLDSTGYGIPCDEYAQMPLVTKNGPGWIEAKSCKVDDLVKAMIDIVVNKGLRKELSEKGLKKGKEWLEGVSDINELFDEVFATDYRTLTVKKEAILFAQHSAAGDVFMTTRCLKGLKKRHPDVPLVYMTQEKYHDILIGNPYIDEIIGWDKSKFSEYRYFYNIHAQKILPGHWGRNSNSILPDFYWKLLDVEPDDFFIEQKKPECTDPIIDALSKSDTPLFAVVHTTGGDPHFRTYKYMEDVCNGLGDKYITIQLGSKNDYPAGADVDLRGKLSFREAAWVMARANVAVTVDSFISHLAGALGVSQVCLFGSGNASVVKPNQVSGQLICLSPDYILNCPGLGPCSASIRDCPVPCMGRHNPITILNSIKEIEKEMENEATVYSIKYA